MRQSVTRNTLGLTKLFFETTITLPGKLLMAAIMGSTSAANAASLLVPTSLDAIAAGARACVGSARDPAGAAARVVKQGWIEGQASKGGKTVSNAPRVFVRQNVLVMLSPPAATKGNAPACVVMGNAGSRFTLPPLVAALNKALGRTPAVGGGVAYQLDGGEALVPQVASTKDGNIVRIVVGRAGTAKR